MFPLDVEELDGRRVLLILVPYERKQVAYFAAGPARWTGAGLRVEYDPAHPAAVARASRAALRGFDPAVLPRLIVPEHRPAVLAAAGEVSACVVAFSRDGVGPTG